MNRRKRLLSTVLIFTMLFSILGIPKNIVAESNLNSGCSNEFKMVESVKVDNTGNLYVLIQITNGNYQIKKMNNQGNISTIVTGLSSQYGPRFSVDPSGNIYFLKFESINSAQVIKMDSEGAVITSYPIEEQVLEFAVDGNGNIYYSNGMGVFKKINSSGGTPVEVPGISQAVDIVNNVNGNIYVIDRFGGFNFQSFTISPNGNISSPTVIPGFGTFMNNNGEVKAADSEGNLYMPYGARIMKISNGSFTEKFTGMNPAAGTLTVDKNNNFYIVAPFTDGIKKISSDGIVTLLGEQTPAAPIITLNLQENQNVNIGDSITFNIGIKPSCEAVQYQWYKNNEPIDGATAPYYSIGAAEQKHAGSYKVIITNSIGFTESNVTALNVGKSDAPSAPSAPTVESKTTTSITLKSETGQEYSIDNGGTWQDSPVFTGLTPDTSYTFITRIKETETTNASTASEGTTSKTEVVSEMGGTVTITGETTHGSTLTTDLTSITYTPTTTSDIPTYQWKRNNVNIAGATQSTYTLTQEDIGSVITVTVTADGAHATGSITSNGTLPIQKADRPSAPSAPIIESKTTTSITLKSETGQEYSMDNGETWGDSPVFTGLTPDTSYTFISRIKETATKKASLASESTSAKTEAVPVMGGTVNITGEIKYGSTLTADLSGVIYTPITTSDIPIYQWKRNNVDIAGATQSTYTLTQGDIGSVITVTVTADGIHAKGSITSNGTISIQKADGPSAPSVPIVESTTTTSITLKSETGQEYSIDNGGNWQSSPVFTGLTSDTSYTFITRIKETATKKASLASESTSAKTEAVPVMGGTVNIAGEIKYGSTLTAELSGVIYTPITTSDIPTYQWKRNNADIEGATQSTYTLTQGDIGSVITVTITADGTHATGSVVSNGTLSIQKADGPNAPNVPIVESKTTTSITLKSETGQEYSMDNGETWRDFPVFTGLTPDTSYTFITRIKETVTKEKSIASAGLTVKTNKVPQNNDGGSSTLPNTNTEEIVVDVDGKDGTNLTKTPIKRTTEPNGQVRDYVSMPEEIAKNTVQKAKQQGYDTARIVIPDTSDKVTEVTVEIPQSALKQLNDGKLKLEIATDNAIIAIPTESISSFNDDLYFRVVPLKSKEQQKQVEERAKKEEIIQEIAHNQTVKVLGRPMEIETNMQSREVSIILPLKDSLPTDAKEKEKILDNLGIYIEHSDGTKEVLQGKVVSYKNNGELGLEFNVNKFSTFTIVYMEGAQAFFDGKATCGKDALTADAIGCVSAKKSVPVYELVNNRLKKADTLSAGHSVPAYEAISPMLGLGGDIWVERTDAIRYETPSKVMLAKNAITGSKREKQIWKGLELRPGQIGKVTVLQDTVIWEKINKTKKLPRILKKGEQYRVYRYVPGMYNLGNGKYVVQDDYVIFKSLK
ncbi:hypothetical protein [Cytobacillus praedii]|uniref:hypothetical protein n=1 Tax=Cytobacillus praedii TaxID=1742358 RepID=UPI002E232808|nr:hypothetical protein [Cytobacillus praedii]